MGLIETEDARDADALHRNLLDLLDVLLPLLRSEGHVARRRADEHDAGLVGGQLERIEDGFRRARGIEDVVEAAPTSLATTCPTRSTSLYLPADFIL